MVLSFANELNRLGFEPSRNLLVNCWDIDKHCCYMVFINLSYFDIPAEIICGNPLLNEISFKLYTPAYYEFRKLEKEDKLKIPLCSRCRKEITDTVYTSELLKNKKLCIDCYRVEKMLLIMKNMSKYK